MKEGTHPWARWDDDTLRGGLVDAVFGVQGLSPLLPSQVRWCDGWMGSLSDPLQLATDVKGRDVMD